MTERPILFNGEMVRAILDGRKTQTRRVIKFPRHTYKPTADWVASVNPDGKDGWIAWGPHKMTDEDSRKAYPNGGGFKCPYGVPGDLLWVRETWAQVPVVEADGGQGDTMGVIYRADGEDAFDEMPDEWEFMGKWRPSIHMPRWASRITLQVTDVRVERVQGISGKDAWAEGIAYNGNGDHDAEANAIDAFHTLWDSINAARGYSWEVNPRVWVVSFERVTA